MAPPIWTTQQIVSNLTRSNLEWSGQIITFGFPQAPQAGMNGGELSGFSAYNTDQKVAARQAITLWDDLVAVDFQETTANPSITFQNTTTSIGYAHAYFPGSWGMAGSVWTNPNYASGTSNLLHPEVGEWGFKSFLHEIGHALGIDHPGNYSGNATYEQQALYRQDTFMYTVMSYFSETKNGADWVASDGRGYSPQTPMIHDILAIQALYGVEGNTRTGNTVYGFNSTANRDVFDFTDNAHPIVSIWDGGGSDTLDFSGFAGASRIDLRPGRFSDCDAMTKNISIAFGTWIENAVGGSSADRILGNNHNNTLTGNGGSDSMSGGNGRDVISGGSGNDTINGNSGDDRLTGGSGADRFVFDCIGIERDVVLDFTDGIDRLVIQSNSADSMGDLDITGQGTTVVTVVAGDETIILRSGSAFTLNSSDLLFD